MSTFVGRHPVLTFLGVIAAIPVGFFVVMMPIGAFVTGGFWAGIGLLAVMGIPVWMVWLSRRSRRMRLHKELVARADYEHSALSRGDI